MTMPFRTDPGLHPSSPPASFTLPPASVTLTPSPTHSDPDARIKRTTEWKWLDPEWKVQFSSSRPTAPVPISPTGPPSPTFSAGAGGIVAGSGNWPNPMPKGDETFFKDWHVDEEGWQYGDNAFEKSVSLQHPVLRKVSLIIVLNGAEWVRKADWESIHAGERGSEERGSSSEKSESLVRHRRPLPSRPAESAPSLLLTPVEWASACQVSTVWAI